jgi:hypothetical protein
MKLRTKYYPRSQIFRITTLTAIIAVFLPQIVSVLRAQSKSNAQKTTQKARVFQYGTCLKPISRAPQIDADLEFGIHIKQMFSELKVARVEKIGDHDPTLLLASNPGRAPLELFFDKDSGLLLRQLRFCEFPSGTESNPN